MYFTGMAAPALTSPKVQGIKTKGVRNHHDTSANHISISDEHPREKKNVVFQRWSETFIVSFT